MTQKPRLASNSFTRRAKATKVSDMSKRYFACAVVYLLKVSSTTFPHDPESSNAGVFVRRNLWDTGDEPTPFYSIPAALWPLFGILFRIIRMSRTAQQESRIARQCAIPILKSRIYIYTFSYCTKVGVHNHNNCWLW